MAVGFSVRLFLWLGLLVILHLVLRRLHEPYRRWSKGLDSMVNLVAIALVILMVGNMIYLFFIKK